MIAFATAITKPEVYRRCAEPGIRRAQEHGSEVLAGPADGTIFASYNAILDRAARLEDLEALVLVHQDTELVDADVCAKVRDALADPLVGIAGCVGAIGVRSIAWWEASVTRRPHQPVQEHGGGDLHSSRGPGTAPPYAHTGEVETLDGFLLVLSPWAVREIRFDETLGESTATTWTTPAGARGGTQGGDRRSPGDPPSTAADAARSGALGRRARRSRRSGTAACPGSGRARAPGANAPGAAEAERDLALSIVHTKALEETARSTAAQHAIAETRGSLSWRLTAALRRFRSAA